MTATRNSTNNNTPPIGSTTPTFGQTALDRPRGTDGCAATSDSDDRPGENGRRAATGNRDTQQRRSDEINRRASLTSRRVVDDAAHQSPADTPSEGTIGGPPNECGSNAQGNGRGERPRSRGRVKIASLNMRGAGHTQNGGPGDKWMRVNQLMKSKHIGILAIQEAHLTDDGATTLNNIFHDSLEIYLSPDPTTPSAARGVAFVINKRVFDVDEGVSYTQIVPGRAAMIEINWGAQNRLNVVNVYAPNNMNENASFWEEIGVSLTRNGHNTPDILLGDFNVVEAEIDRQPTRQDPEPARSSLAELKTKLKIVDGWRKVNPDHQDFSYLQTGTGSQSRIDRIYVKESLLSKAADWNIEAPGIDTDHSMVSTTLANYKCPYIGPGRWVIPAAVISDSLFIQETISEGRSALEKMTSDECQLEGRNIQRIYQAFKASIRNRARRRAKELFAKWDKEIHDLKRDIESENRHGREENAEGEHSRVTAAILKDKLAKLEMKRFENKREEAKLRQWLEGERMNRFW
ncbi:Endonuclease/exonuclease/phosphatase, partial [Lenzites betulinus]